MFVVGYNVVQNEQVFLRTSLPSPVPEVFPMSDRVSRWDVM